MTRDEISNEKIIEVLEQKAGLIQPTAKALNIARRTLYYWIEDDKELQEAVKQCRESMIDMAESTLLTKIKDGDTTSTIFYLKTQGKQRGYVERQENAVFVEQQMFPDDEHDETGAFDEDDDLD